LGVRPTSRLHPFKPPFVSPFVLVAENGGFWLLLALLAPNQSRPLSEA
jgi:hypothetical protein